jgi:predicted dehydrogenase
MKEPVNRRKFIARTAAAGVGLGLAPGLTVLAEPLPARSGIVPGSGRMNVAVIGTHGRGIDHIRCLTGIPDVEITYICDVDDRAIAKGLQETQRHQATEPQGLKDFRQALGDRRLDAVTIATPDHWHAPMAIQCLAAGKHVYVEKPCSHNPYEGELLAEAVGKSGRVLQMGNQRRSFPNLQQAIRDIHNGIIGKAYFGRSWYVNNRPSIGHGKPAPVPGWLDYDLWQGPAPRRPYRDNLIHYNWHWFWHWGTGEALNNGTHEVDVCRWALGVDWPIRVCSNGGRYQFQDDWETPDTQTISWDYAEGKTITWEGRSCNDYPDERLSRGVMIYGTEGSALLDGNDCAIFDRKNKVIKEFKKAVAPDSSQSVHDSNIQLSRLHFQDFVTAIRTGKQPNSPIAEGHKSVAMLHLGNIAWRIGRELNCDPANGHVRDDADAMKLWRRDYEPGWEPKV